MKRLGVVLSGILLGATLCYGQTSTAPAQAAGHVVAQGSFPVQVVKTLDSSKLKDGDTVQLETTGSFKLLDGTVVPKGTKVEGKVVMAKARSKGDPESQLTLTFSKLKIGEKEIMINGSVQAVYPPAEEPEGPNMATAGTSQGGSMGGVGPGGAPTGVNPGGIGITNAKTGSNTESSSNSQAVMNLKATGVQGIHGLSLDNGAITSKGKNVKLGDGVRMVVHADFLG